MKIHRLLILTCLLALPTTHPALAEPAEGNPHKVADALWDEYAEARGGLTKTKMPQFGEKDFSRKLSDWSQAYTRFREAGRALFPPLAQLASDVPVGEFRTVAEDLRNIHGETQARPSQASHDDLKYFSQIILPHVRDKDLAPDCAALFAELTTPDALIRQCDDRIKKGQISEPNGWTTQDVHALALARAGKFAAARTESDLLLKKLSKHVAMPRQFGLNHQGRVRTKASVYRETLLHRALIEALAGDKKAAETHLAEADAIAEPDAGIKKAHALLKTAIEKRIAG